MKYLLDLVAIVGTLLYRNSFARTATELKVRNRGKKTLGSSVFVLYYCGQSFFTYFGLRLLTHSFTY